MFHNLGQETHEDLSKLVEVSNDCKITRLHDKDPNLRPVVAASLGMHVQGVALPKPDLQHTRTALDGAHYRFCRNIPGMNRFHKKFAIFVKNWLEKNLDPLPVDTDVSIETWLQETNYSEARKQELRTKYKDMSGLSMKEMSEVKSFVKDEFYPEYKPARAINSRSDQFKVLVGPWFKAAEKRLFSLPYFIKKIPVGDRPKYILDNVFRVGNKTYTTDFTSFESHFTKWFMEECDFQFNRHVFKHLPNGLNMCRLIEDVIGGENKIKFKNFSLKIDAKKMSGEMNTSLSNGFANLMLILFILEENGCTNIRVCVEGDDGIFQAEGPEIKSEWFKDFGLLIKLEEHEELETASFCGLIFDRDEEKNVTDPIKAMATFGWTTSTYARSRRGIHNSLLKCKALSLGYQYPCCPILTALARKTIQLTQGCEVKDFIKKHKINDEYKQRILEEAVDKYVSNELVFGEPGPKTRILVERLFKIPIADQVKIEKYIDSLESIQPLDHPIIDLHMPALWKKNFANYAMVKDKYSKNFDYEPDFFLKVRRESCLRTFIA